LRALERQGLHTPTTVQIQAIPAVLSGKDTLARAQTGSGKTLAFGLPLLHKLALEPALNPRQVRALVLVPTRELAIQVGTALRDLANQLPQAIKISVVFGGVSINPQMLAMRGGTDVVVATPGRLLDLVQRNALSLDHTQMLVLDEADRLLDLGFEAELTRLLSLLPANRQNLFFSATFASAVTALAQSMLKEPVQIEVAGADQEKPAITQRAIRVDAPQRTQLLRHLITEQKWKRVLVFVATKHATEIVADKLRKSRIYAEPFHGELSQGKRSQVLSDFKASRLKVVVAGETGLALSFVSRDTEAHFHLIEKRHGLHVEMEVIAGFEPQGGLLTRVVAADDELLQTLPTPTPTEPPHTGGIKGSRPSKKDKLRAQAAKLQNG
jgi:superfamily II DNA/RNA helicase